MKRAALTTIMLAWLTASFSQSSLQRKNYFIADMDSLSALPTMEKMLSDIVAVSGLSTSFVIRQGDVENMQASISKKKRVIVYNPEFIRWLYVATHDKWATVTLLAHEVGHHLNGHTIRHGGSRPHVELEADEFAGFILSRLGATLPQAQEVMKYIATKDGSSTHPARDERMEAIERGWSRGSSASR
jgi:hypothetical protein